MRYTSLLAALPLALAACALGLEAQAQTITRIQPRKSEVPAASRNGGAEARSAQDRVADAVAVVDQMKRDPQLAQLLEQAKGVFIVPHYGKGAFIVGGQGGGGVMLARRGNEWTSPAFFSTGGGSVGAQAGGEGGSIVMILMSEKALDEFANADGTWALNGNAGLTVVTWSGKAQAETGNGDVVLWANTSGLHGGLTAGVTDITPDTNLDHAYYRRKAGSREILAGAVSNAGAAALRDALATRVASK